jgi:hypothetical protein
VKLVDLRIKLEHHGKGFQTGRASHCAPCSWQSFGCCWLPWLNVNNAPEVAKSVSVNSRRRALEPGWKWKCQLPNLVFPKREWKPERSCCISLAVHLLRPGVPAEDVIPPCCRDSTASRPSTSNHSTWKLCLLLCRQCDRRQ